MRSDDMDDLEKPLPVVIVEAIALMYVLLAVLLFAFAIVIACRDGSESFSGILFVILFGLCLMSLPVGMALSLRRGRRTWFLAPNTIVMGLCLIGAVTSFGDSMAALPVGLFALLLGIAPIVLLNLPSSSRWSNEMSGDDAPDHCGCAVIVVVGVLWLAFVGPCLSDLYFSKRRTLNALSHAMAMRGRELDESMRLNNLSPESGEDWIDASSCTNSTQFVQALCKKCKDSAVGRSCDFGPYANDWCIAVNPPNDDRFPVLFTANIDPRELLCPQDEDQPLKLTCPKEWGGVCFKFCEKMGVVHYKNGVSQIVKKHMYPKQIFCSGIPKPGPETYFLTPTGRVDFVERQAADWLSIHEFASNEDSGDVSVKWRVAWPESLSGLNNEGLSSVRREILQMTFGPAWSDLNHGDKTWIPPPTIEEAEEEIKRKLEEPDILWEFSGDVELDRPFGASLQDGAEWYARPVIVAKNDGNSSFWRECGCTYYTIARTFSIPDGREMTVDDYFDRGKMKELSALVWRRLLESVFPFDDETRKGMGHRDINLRDRNLIFMRVMSGGICFYFAPYSIFSGSEGVTKAFLKWGELSKFRKK